MKSHLPLLALLALFGACGGDSKSATGDASDNADAGVPPADASRLGSDAQAAPDHESDAEVLAVDAVLAELSAATNKLALVAGVDETVPECPTGQLACNGGCLDRNTQGASGHGCSVLGGQFSELSDLQIDGDRAYASGRRSATSGEAVYALALDGSSVTALSAEAAPEASVIGVVQNKVVVISSSGCTNSTSFANCLSVLPRAGGNASPLFPELLDPESLSIFDGSLLYASRDSTGISRIYTRTLFDGAAVLRFAAEDLDNFASNGRWAFFSRGGNDFDDQYLLTQLGAAGTTLKVAEGFSDPFSSVFFAGDYLYLARRLESEGADYQRIKLGSTSGEAVAQLPVLPVAMSAHGDFVYFAGFSETADRLYRMPLQGGPITPIATFKHSELANYVATDSAVYAQLLLDEGTAVVRIALP